MGFLLGSFTDGLSGGAKDIASIARDWEGYKQDKIKTQNQQLDLDTRQTVTDAAAAQRAKESSKAADDAANPNPGVATTAPAKTNGKSSYTDKDLESLPKPNFMRPIMPAINPSSEREKQAYGTQPTASSLPDTGSSPREGRGSGALPTDNGWSFDPVSGMGFNAKPTTTLPAGYQGYQGPAITSPPAAPGSSALPTGRQAPPQYIPGSGTPVTQLTPPATTPQQVIGGVPNLANSQQGLGGQILAALNPTSRPV